ncbi:MAG: hypothetical protein WC323_00825 [Patescibacteria group bacterium]|jgi:uncharacterized membrane protein
MERTTNKTKLPWKIRGEIKKVATHEDKTVVAIPEVIRVTIVAVEPELVAIVFNVEQVEVAVRISNV